MWALNLSMGSRHPMEKDAMGLNSNPGSRPCAPRCWAEEGGPQPRSPNLLPLNTSILREETGFYKQGSLVKYTQGKLWAHWKRLYGGTYQCLYCVPRAAILFRNVRTCICSQRYRIMEFL